LVVDLVIAREDLLKVAVAKFSVAISASQTHTLLPTHARKVTHTLLMFGGHLVEVARLLLVLATSI